MASYNSKRTHFLYFPAVLLTVWCLLPPVAGGAPSIPARASASVERFRASMRRILSRSEARLGDWGILVVDEGTGQTLYELNASHYFTPASNAKLFTATLALAELGPDYRWRTTLETTGHIDPAGTLDGNLVLVGRGDPNLSNRIFPYGDKVQVDGPPEKVIADLADQLVARGVKRITGGVVADDSYFTYERYPPGWNIDDLTADYGAPVSAIVIDDNDLEIDVAPGARAGDPATIAAVPWAAFYHFVNHVTTVRRGLDAQLTLSREPDSFDITVTGQVPVGSPPQQSWIAIEQPARYTASLLKHLLVERGVTVDGGTWAEHLLPNQTPPPPQEREVLAEHQSPTLAEALRYLLKVSQNLHAECLLRTVAHERTGVGSLENGLAVEREFLARLGIADDVMFFDGSGLSRYDLVTPRALVTLLRYDARQSWAQVLRDSLPVAGIDGTLENRMSHTLAAGHVFAKTGSLVHDNSLSGYATTLGGRRIVFSILVNNTPPHAKFDPYIDQIVEAMVEDLGASARREPERRPHRQERHGPYAERH
ncbi:MAG: D-alanyl-D-alanine carboxypeptidase/D-alanyl-D-alanine-endopeptidase [Acidobacteriota bacterium]|nr:D-alanyl-D-alanine carboxypeptidase/D-alanyl-D-alanine-endopeptidase [Acidobacteriota bacterium]